MKVWQNLKLRSTCSSDNLRELLLICERFAQKWGIDFNISKCKFIVFGSSKYNSLIFLLNNLKINYTEKLKKTEKIHRVFPTLSHI